MVVVYLMVFGNWPGIAFFAVGGLLYNGRSLTVDGSAAFN
jgi:hypothetical protein